jgi:hypothetical protein
MKPDPPTAKTSDEALLQTLLRLMLVPLVRALQAETGRAVGLGVGVSVSVGLSVDVGAGVGVSVSVGLSVDVGAGVGVSVSVGIGVAVSVVVGVRAGVGVAAFSAQASVPSISTSTIKGINTMVSFRMFSPPVVPHAVPKVWDIVTFSPSPVIGLPRVLLV